MEIQLRLYGALRRYRPQEAPGFGAFTLGVAEGATVAVVADQLGIPRSWMQGVFVNEEASAVEQVLNPGDRVALFPPAGGGWE